MQPLKIMIMKISNLEKWPWYDLNLLYTMLILQSLSIYHRYRGKKQVAVFGDKI